MATPTRLKPKFLTYRVQNIPYGVSKDELKGYFYMEDRDDIKIKSLCPSVDTPEGQEGEYTATIFFRPHEDYERAPRIAIDDIDIDKTFIGFTPLHVPTREQGPIAADIIAISGLAGHAYGSWAHSPEHMWIRDYLPRDAPNARILTYGYPASLQYNTSISTLQDYTATFVQSLIAMRDSGECESRPIIFIGHSLGCLIIKKALADIALMGVNPSRLPVRTIVFLAAPHRGLNVTAMQTLVKGKATQALVDELSGGSRTLIEISARFAHIAGDIDILTCYETKPTSTAIEVDGIWQRSGEPAMMVKLDSAQLFFPRESLMSAETDHSQISKIKRGEGGIYSRVKSAIRQGLVSTARIVASVEANPESLVQRQVSSTKDVAPPYTSQINPTILSERPKHGSEGSNLRAVTSTPLASPTPDLVQQESFPLNLNTVTTTPLASPAPDLVDIKVEQEPISFNMSTATTTPLASPTTNIVSEQESALFNVCATGTTLVSEQESAPLNLSTITMPPAGPMPNLVDSEQNSSLLNMRTTTTTPLATTTTKMVNFKQKSCSLNPEDTNEVKPITPEPKPVEKEAVPESTAVEDDPDLQTRSRRICNICKRECLVQELVYSCQPCDIKREDDSQFKICYQCEAKGILCPNNKGDGHHKLKAYIFKGWSYQPAPMPEIIKSDLPIFRAIKARNAKTLTSLVKSENTQTFRNNEGRTPLNLAIQLGFEDMVRVLLDVPVSLEAMDDHGLTPLMMAIKYLYPNILRMLLDEGADVNGSKEGPTPLYVAAFCKNEDCLKILLEYKPVIDAVNKYGRTPLGECCLRCYIGCAKLLLNAGADPNFNYKGPGRLPLFIAVNKDNRNMIDLLLCHGAEIDVKNSVGATPLMLAADGGLAVASDILIDAGARVNTINPESWTALMYACWKGNLDIVTQLLTKTNANVNGTTSKKWSALTLAAQEGHMEIVKMLIKHGATGNPTPCIKWKNFYFIDSVTSSTKEKILDIVRPFKHRSEVAPPRDPRLPEKWERKVDKNGKSYYVDQTGTIHWKLPKKDTSI